MKRKVECMREGLLLKSECNDTLTGADAILMQKEVKAAKRRVAENRKKRHI